MLTVARDCLENKQSKTVFSCEKTNIIVTCLKYQSPHTDWQHLMKPFKYSILITSKAVESLLSLSAWFENEKGNFI